MTKLEETLQAHPDMTPVAITRIEIAKVSEPVLRAALEAVVDLIELQRFESEQPPASAPNLFAAQMGETHEGGPPHV